MRAPRPPPLRSQDPHYGAGRKFIKVFIFPQVKKLWGCHKKMWKDNFTFIFYVKMGSKVSKSTKKN